MLPAAARAQVMDMPFVVDRLLQSSMLGSLSNLTQLSLNKGLQFDRLARGLVVSTHYKEPLTQQLSQLTQLRRLCASGSVAFGCMLGSGPAMSAALQRLVLLQQLDLKACVLRPEAAPALAQVR